MKKLNLIYSLGGAVAATLLVPSISVATENPFAMQSLSNGIEVAEMTKGAEGKCGAGKKESMKMTDKTAEGRCGEGKCGDKSASSEKPMEKTSEGKCGEGKCGDKS